VTWMTAKEIIMANKKKAIDPLPESFSTEQEAGEFWDTHSAADYAEFLEPAGEGFDIGKRVFEVQVSEEVFNRLLKKAESSRQSVPVTVDQILRKELSLAEP
jgi:vacuolar-type H+-ATPase subunit C/Vma6